MKRKTSTLAVADAGGIERGDGLRIDDGPHSETVRVLAVDGSQVTVGRWRWHHTAVWRLRRAVAAVALWLRAWIWNPLADVWYWLKSLLAP